jgi:hypothetical protein
MPGCSLGLVTLKRWGLSIFGQFLHGAVNVQHDCHEGQCTVEKTLITPKERQKSKQKAWQVEHTNNSRYVINSGSLHDAPIHQALASLSGDRITEEQWIDCIETGYSNWVGEGGGVASDCEDDSSDAVGDAYPAAGQLDDESESPPGGDSDSADSEGTSNPHSSDEDAEGETDDGDDADWEGYGCDEDEHHPHPASDSVLHH